MICVNHTRQSFFMKSLHNSVAPLNAPFAPSDTNLKLIQQIQQHGDIYHTIGRGAFQDGVSTSKKALTLKARSALPRRGRRTRTLNKGFGDPRVTITPCPYAVVVTGTMNIISRKKNFVKAYFLNFAHHEKVCHLPTQTQQSLPYGPAFNLARRMLHFVWHKGGAADLSDMLPLRGE